MKNFKEPKVKVTTAMEPGTSSRVEFKVGSEVEFTLKDGTIFTVCAWEDDGRLELRCLHSAVSIEPSATNSFYIKAVPRT